MTAHMPSLAQIAVALGGEVRGLEVLAPVSPKEAFDILNVPPEWMAKTCREHVHRLKPLEREFVDNMSRCRKPPTDLQFAWLTAICERLQEGAP